MPLKPLDIHNKEFRRKFRGYAEAEVDEFLDLVVRDMEALLAENAQLRERTGDLEEKLTYYRALEETLRDTLVIAQKTADEVKQTARREADVLLREAELKAESVVGDTEERARRLSDEYADLKRQCVVLRARIKGLVQAHVELVDRQVEDIEREFPDRTDAVSPINDEGGVVS